MMFYFRQLYNYEIYFLNLPKKDRSLQFISCDLIFMIGDLFITILDHGGQK